MEILKAGKGMDNDLDKHNIGIGTNLALNKLHCHDVDIHNGVEQIYQTRILSTEKNLLPLCILEGLHIEKQNKLLSMNDKNEFGRGGVIRLTANRIT